MEEEWYEIILEDLEDLGETLRVLVEDGEFFRTAKNKPYRRNVGIGMNLI